jgi:hypothetical protein
MHTRPDTQAIHEWFGLSYTNYLVLHRTLLQSMPEEWQHQFVDLLEQLRAAFAHIEQPDYFQVHAATEHLVNEMTPELRGRAGITVDEHGGKKPPKRLSPAELADWEATHQSEETLYHNADGQELHPGERILLPAPDPVPHYNRGRTYIEPRIEPHPSEPAGQPATEPAEHRAIAHTDAYATYPWPSDIYIQGGSSGVVLNNDGSHTITAFFEAFPAGTFLRGEGATLAEAEEACWRAYKTFRDCPHGEYERRGYRNGSGFCVTCGTWMNGVFEPLPDDADGSAPRGLMERVLAGDQQALDSVAAALQSLAAAREGANR